MPKFKLYGGREGVAEFRTMALEEAKLLGYGDMIWFIDTKGSARRLKVNGRPKRWVRQPDKIAVPVKYGMYEYDTFTASDFGPNGRALVQL